MTKFTVAQLDAPMGKPQFEVGIADPGIVRHVAFTMTQNPILIAGRPQFEERLSMFVEVTGEGTRRNRRFVIMQEGQALTVPDGQRADFQGTAISAQSGLVVHVYELKAVS